MKASLLHTTLFFLIAFPDVSVQAADVLCVGEGREEYNVVTYLHVLIDHDTTWTIQDVTSSPLANDFLPNKKKWLGLGFTRAAVWIRFSLENKGDEGSGKWILDLNVPSIDQADLYTPAGDGRFTLQRGGMTVPFSQKAMRLRTHAYPLTLAPGARKTFYMRLKSETALVVDLKLFTPKACLEIERRDMNLFFLFAGAFLTIMISNLMVYLSTRDRNYLNLVFFITSLGFFMAVNFGLAPLFLWPENPTIARLSSPFFGALCVFWGLVFTRRFIDAKTNMPRLDHLFRATIPLAIVLILLTFIESYAASLLVGILSVFAMFLGLYACFAGLRHRYEATRPFYFVMAISMVGGILFLLMAFGFLGMSIWTFGMGPIAFLGGILLLIMALGARLITFQSNYMQIFNSVNDAIFIYDLKTDEVLDVNQKACELYGYAREELLKRGIGVIMRSRAKHDSTDDTTKWMNRADRDGPQLVEGQLEKKNGEPFWGEVNLIRASLRNRQCILGVVRDVTDRKQMEEELLRTQKLESLNLLAGGIAHDFNNILTTILSNVSMARVYGDLQEDISNLLSDAERATLRARDLTAQLLAFTMGGAPVRKTISLPLLLKETAEFVLSGSNVKCEHAIAEDLWLLEADKGQIGQVIQNLVMNADQAMPHGGILRIAAENVRIHEKGPLPLEKGRYVRIDVTDHGDGIPGTHLQKIFDPFFTTKREGSGLGLTSCLSIVKKHHGHIEVNSQKDLGTTFSVYLSASDETSVTEEVEKGGPVKGEGRILLVDDEEMIRKSVGNLLKHLGYEVGVAGDGREGIKRYKEAMKKGRPFDLVVMDLTIPGGMGGKEAVGELKRLDAEVNVIATSGYADEPVLANYSAYGFCDILKKPYKLSEFSEVIHRAIQKRGRRNRV